MSGTDPPRSANETTTTAIDDELDRIEREIAIERPPSASGSSSVNPAGTSTTA